MQFNSETTQFINTNFFEAEAKDEKNYQTLVTIFGIFTYFPFATFIVLIYFALVYSDRIANYAMRYIMVGNFDLSSKEKRASTFLSGFLLCHDNNSSYNVRESNRKNTGVKDNEEDRRTIILGLSITCTFLTFALFAFHVTASIKLIQYGNKVLYQHDDDDNDGDSGRNDHHLPIIYVIMSLLLGITIIIILIALHAMTIRGLYKLLQTDQT